MALHTDQWYAACGPWPFRKWPIEPSATHIINALSYECYVLIIRANVFDYLHAIMLHQVGGVFKILILVKKKKASTRTAWLFSDDEFHVINELRPDLYSPRSLVYARARLEGTMKSPLWASLPYDVHRTSRVCGFAIRRDQTLCSS